MLLLTFGGVLFRQPPGRLQGRVRLRWQRPQKFCLGLACNPKYVQGFVEGCLERIGEDEPEDEDLFRNLWEDEAERETVLVVLQAECEILPSRPEDYFPY